MEKALKVCTYCEKEKELTEFYDKERYYCIECERSTARERMKRYNATPKGKVMAALSSSRKAVRKIEAETGREIKDDLTFFDVAFVLGYSECSYCDKETPESERTVDHIIPMKQGGDNTFANITMACFKCNRSKNDYPALSYLHKRDDDYGIKQLAEKIAIREMISYDDAYMILFEHAVNYFEEQMEEKKR